MKFVSARPPMGRRELMALSDKLLRHSARMARVGERLCCLNLEDSESAIAKKALDRANQLFPAAEHDSPGAVLEAARLLLKQATKMKRKKGDEK